MTLSQQIDRAVERDRAAGVDALYAPAGVADTVYSLREAIRHLDDARGDCDCAGLRRWTDTLSSVISEVADVMEAMDSEPGEDG